MRILLVGEYSNVHNTLAQALRLAGHNVTVVSDGDSWKNYPRDIDISRPLSSSRYASLIFNLRVMSILPKMRGYDIVQIINSSFLYAKPWLNKMVFNYLRRFNRKVFMGAFGVDYYWVKACMGQKLFRYSDFYAYGREIPNQRNVGAVKEWINGPKKNLNKFTAEHCDGIIACLYEYYASYREEFADKLTYIPLPINTQIIPQNPIQGPIGKVRFFIGIQPARSVSKGTDVIFRVLQRVVAKYPQDAEIIKAEGIPYEQYIKMMRSSHILLDQLYSYTPAMNALIAMAQGLVVGSGAEEEYYSLQGETILHPIINLDPDEQILEKTLEHIILNKEMIPELSRQSIEFVNKYHDYRKVAQCYLDFWQSARS